MAGLSELQQREICDHARALRAVTLAASALEAPALAQGLRVHLVGPSGSGRGRAARAIAAELGATLRRVDLSTVISKYIGETEQNLRHVFEDAESADDILFFDEADALFGKRSEVRDAHDRYAELQISYLLQRLAEHGGVAIFRCTRDPCSTEPPPRTFTVRF